MVSFSKLPYEIKEAIFSKIRIRDLYEVSVVSEEWWWLTLKTYKAILFKDDLLIQTLLTFFNGAKQLSTPLIWFNLIKCGTFSGVELQDNPGNLILQTFLESKQPIRCLCLITKLWLLDSVVPSVETRLDAILKYFPNLEKLKLQDFPLVLSSLKIPKGIKEVHLSGIEAYGVAWSDLLEDPESIQSLELHVAGLTYDHLVVKNLRSLTLKFEEPLAVHQMKSILYLIRNHKNLKSVKLVGVTVTKEWFNLFGKSIESIILENIHINVQLLTELGNDGCFERRLRSFLCCDFRTVKRFTLNVLSTDFDDLLEGDEEDIFIDYRAYFTWKPVLMKERLLLKLNSDLSRQVRTITATDPGTALRDLHITFNHVKVHLLTNCVPSSVRKFQLDFDGDSENVSIDQLCEQPQNLEECNFNSLSVISSLSIQRDGFTSCTRLKILIMAHVNQEGLQNILRHCICLEKLSLKNPESGCFTNSSPPFVRKTLREVKLEESDANLEDVLYLFPNLEVLVLSSHLICPVSMPTAIATLKLFSAKFYDSIFSDRSIDIRRDYSNLPLVMDTVDVPFKLFYLNEFTCEFVLARNDTFIDDWYTRDGFAYSRGFPSRFLEASDVKIIEDVKHLSEICLNRL